MEKKRATSLNGWSIKRREHLVTRARVGQTDFSSIPYSFNRSSVSLSLSLIHASVLPSFPSSSSLLKTSLNWLGRTLLCVRTCGWMRNSSGYGNVVRSEAQSVMSRERNLFIKNGRPVGRLYTRRRKKRRIKSAVESIDRIYRLRTRVLCSLERTPLWTRKGVKLLVYILYVHVYFYLFDRSDRSNNKRNASFILLVSDLVIKHVLHTDHVGLERRNCPLPLLRCESPVQNVIKPFFNRSPLVARHYRVSPRVDAFLSGSLMDRRVTRKATEKRVRLELMNRWNNSRERERNFGKKGLKAIE